MRFCLCALGRGNCWYWEACSVAGIDRTHTEEWGQKLICMLIAGTELSEHLLKMIFARKLRGFPIEND